MGNSGFNKLDIIHYSVLLGSVYCQDRIYLKGSVDVEAFA